jgi:hypothetical protein
VNGYVFDEQDLKAAKEHFATVVAIILPKVKRVLGIM